MSRKRNGGKPQGPSTRAVHSGGAAHVPGQPVVNPIVQSATFYTDALPAGEVLYTRYGTNPNHTALACRLAELEGAEAAIVLASGNAATALALLAHLRAGDHVVAQRELYGGTLALLARELPRLGIETTFVDFADWEHAIRPETRALFMEAPVNPTLRMPDVRVVGAIARARGLPLLIDATFATPLNFRPLEHGATAVIHSATKYLGGHSDLTAGVVAGSAAMVEEVREKLKTFGPVLDPHAVWLLERGVKTLSVRMERHNQNGLEVAAKLEGHPAVERVFYPGLASHRDHKVARELLDGFGGMVSIVVRGGDDAALRVSSRLRVMSVAPSLGGVESLVSMPRFTSHAALTREQRHAIDIGDGFIRLSLGIEDADDLWADLEQALEPEVDASGETGTDAALQAVSPHPPIAPIPPSPQPLIDRTAVAVVGAGPCGLGVGVAARQAGLSCILFDKSCVVSALTAYPTHMTFFSTAERLELGGVPFTTISDKPGRREAIRYYHRIVRHFELDVRQYTGVDRIHRIDDGFRLHTICRDGSWCERQADAVVIATGYLDTPCLLGIPGEDLPNVSHYYREGSPYFNQKCMVIGGGNSAVDAALDLHRWGADVTLVHFADALDPGVKPWILPDIASRIKSGAIQTRWLTRVVEITPASVVLGSAERGTEVVENDWVFAMTGYLPDPTLLASLGVSIDLSTGIPTHDPETMMTNQPCVYIAGVIAAGFNANKIFIENGREHGPRIMQDLLAQKARRP